MGRALSLILICCNGLAGCERGAPRERGSTTATSSEVRPDTSDALRRLLTAEQHRAPALVTEEDRRCQDVVVRRQAARALARIADPTAADRLRAMLADEDGEVVAWAAYGVGLTCAEQKDATVRALMARAASLMDPARARPPADHDREYRRLAVEPLDAIASALARCATAQAEGSLRAWLDGPQDRAEIAAASLGRLAAWHGRVQDSSAIALLDAASRPDAPLHNALLAFSHLGGLGDSLKRRLRDVAQEALVKPGRRRGFAVRALSRAGAEAAPVLGEVLADGGFSVSDRSEAARGLARLEGAGQAVLRDTVAALLADDGRVAPDTLLSAEWAPVAAALDALEPPVGDLAQALTRLVELPVEADASPAIRRRIVTLRCAAAALLAGQAVHHPGLSSCDPDENGRAGAMAALRVLDRGEIQGARYQRWTALMAANDPMVRRAALALMPAHPEIPAPDKVLAAALEAEAPGVVATAARVLAAYPDRAASIRMAAPRPGPSGAGDLTGAPRAAPAPSEAIVRALTAALTAARPPDDTETRGALMHAAAQLQLLSLKPAIEGHCASGNPTLRHHAQRALRVLGDPRQCPGQAPANAPENPQATPGGRVTLTFVTDAGRQALTLDAALAPAAVARVVGLARDGFYDGLAIHRVVPGFVVQLGDPGGDGYGGAGLEPIPSETSPASFDALHVGMAIAGRDTGSSQIFITLAPQPHLDGDYPLIGWADPEWATVVEGDVIRKVVVTD